MVVSIIDINPSLEVPAVMLVEAACALFGVMNGKFKAIGWLPMNDPEVKVILNTFPDKLLAQEALPGCVTMQDGELPKENEE